MKYRFRFMAGRCRGDLDRAGHIAHIVPFDAGSFGKALCGAKPGKSGNGWSEYDSVEPTCGKCIARRPAPVDAPAETPFGEALDGGSEVDQ